jgi:hypothetical protein
VTPGFPSTGAIRALALVGVVASLLVAALTVALSSDWGPRGSPAYERYELANRALGLLLVGLIPAPVALRLAIAVGPDTRMLRAVLAAIAVALVVLVIGNAAEFWLFTDAPYQGPGSEGRLLAWMSFLIGALVVVGLTIVAGALAWNVRQVARPLALVVLIAAPVGIAVAVAGGPFLIAIPMATGALAGAALVTTIEPQPEPVR